ncbi:MAG: thioesterase family protein [Frankiaceae bacterium]|nr:thioesterase family protein [Frankiaceae bacterium]
MTEQATGADAVEQFLSVLEIERIGTDEFRAWNPPQPKRRFQQTLFGGQVAAHALRAAIATVDAEHAPHSLHAYFLRPGKNDASTTLRVERLRDGRSFSTRTVVACQDDEPIFTVTASFHKDEPGGDFATPIATDVPGPDDLADSQTELSRTLWGEDSPFERLEVPEYSHTRQSPTPRRAMWIRSRAALPDDPGLHACVITFLSDMGVLAAVRAARSGSERPAMAASLDHAVWFHRPARADEWLLFDVAARSSASSRGLGIGTMHTLGGVHAVTVGQEGLVRL